MISAAFFVLLMMSVISANRMLVESAQTIYEAEAYDLSVSIAQDLLVEASGKKFDEYATATGTESATAFSTCGPNAGETVSPSPDTAPFKSASVFDDVDDYTGYQRTVDATTIKGFSVTADVYYLTGTNLDVRTTTKTYFKRIDVSVEHTQYLIKKVTFSRIVTY